jgi:hypothetical protein
MGIAGIPGWLDGASPLTFLNDTLDGGLAPSASFASWDMLIPDLY